MKRMSLVSPDEVRKHLANRSPSKVVHTFSKSQRFLPPNPQCPNAFYLTSSSELSDRKTSIGYGKKYDFTRSTVVSPGSPTYSSRSQFDKNKNKGKSFASSRDRSPDRSYIQLQKQKIPGPGQYENQVKTRTTISFTHRPKTLDVQAKHLSFKFSPGPGKYESLDLEPKGGRFRISKFNDVKLAKINANSARFSKESVVTPSPNAYTQPDNLNAYAKYILSRRQGQGLRSFDHEAKFTFKYWKKDQNPGPGQYENNSIFGVYGDAKYYKTLMTLGS